jgi:hypothetical protein
VVLFFVSDPTIFISVGWCHGSKDDGNSPPILLTILYVLEPFASTAGLGLRLGCIALVVHSIVAAQLTQVLLAHQLEQQLRLADGGVPYGSVGESTATIVKPHSLVGVEVLL